MRLTAVLCKFHHNFIGKIPKFRGSALTGKHKFVPPATKGTRYLLWNQWAQQEEAMKYLSTPYISADEELDYLETLGRKTHDVDPLYTCKLEPPMRQKYAIEILEKFDRSRQHEIWD